MKYIKQILIILLISFAGECFNYFIPLPIPGSIYGMVLMFMLLCLRVIQVHQIKDVGSFFLVIMPMLFVPSAVGIMAQMDQLKSVWIQVIVITILSTVITMAVTGLVSQAIIRWKRREGNGDGTSE